MKKLIISVLFSGLMLTGCVVVPGPIGVIGEYGSAVVQPNPIYVNGANSYYHNVIVLPSPVYRRPINTSNPIMITTSPPPPPPTYDTSYWRGSRESEKMVREYNRQVMRNYVNSQAFFHQEKIVIYDY